MAWCVSPLCSSASACATTRKSWFAQIGMRQPGSVGIIRVQLGQCVIPLAEPVPQYRGGDPGRMIGVSAALGGIAGVPEHQLDLRPAVEVLQREDPGRAGEGGLIRARPDQRDVSQGNRITGTNYLSLAP